MTHCSLGPKGRFHRSTLCGAYSSEASLKKAKRLKETTPMRRFKPAIWWSSGGISIGE